MKASASLAYAARSFRPFALLLLAASCFALQPQARAQQPGYDFSSGIYNSLEELAFVKQKVESGADPWQSAFERMAGHSGRGGGEPYSSFAYAPSPKETVTSCNLRYGKFWYQDDATAAYVHALMWYLLQDTSPGAADRHARKTIEILDAHARTTKRVEVVRDGCGHPYDHYLRFGLAGGTYVAAADLIRHTYANQPGKRWQGAAAFSGYLRGVVWPATYYEATGNDSACDEGCSHFAFMGEIGVYKNPWGPEKNHRAGNWEAAFARTRLAIAAYLRDAERYEEAVQFARWVLERNVVTPEGENTEMCRDTHHPAFGLGLLVMAAEVAHQQGTDLYGALPTPACVPGSEASCTGYRLANGVEFMAAATLERLPVKSPRCTRCEAPHTDLTLEGYLGDPHYAYYYVARNHYTNRLGIALPYTERAINERALGGARWASFFPFADLTHVALPEPKTD